MRASFVYLLKKKSLYPLDVLTVVYKLTIATVSAR
jgi:hypothetical protein